MSGEPVLFFGMMVAMINGISTIYNDLSREKNPNGVFFPTEISVFQGNLGC